MMFCCWDYCGTAADLHRRKSLSSLFASAALIIPSLGCWSGIADFPSGNLILISITGGINLSKHMILWDIMHRLPVKINTLISINYLAFPSHLMSVFWMIYSKGTRENMQIITVYLLQQNFIKVSSNLTWSWWLGLYIMALCRAQNLLHRSSQIQCSANVSRDRSATLKGLRPGSRQRQHGPSVMQGSMRSAAKWSSRLCCADEGDIAHQETDPWAMLLCSSLWENARGQAEGLAALWINEETFLKPYCPDKL